MNWGATEASSYDGRLMFETHGPSDGIKGGIYNDNILNDNELHIGVLVSNENNLYLYSDGKENSDVKSNVGIFGTSGTNNITIAGSTFIHDELSYSGYLYEIIIFDNSSLSNVIKINNYLSNKWNLTSTVDSDDDGIVDASDPFPTDPNKWISFPQALRDNASDNFTAMNGLALWLDATNIDGNTNSNLSHNNPINEWKDLSGNNNHLLASTSGSVSFNSSEINPKINFDGNGYLSISDKEKLKFTQNPHSIFIVTNPSAIIENDIISTNLIDHAQGGVLLMFYQNRIRSHLFKPTLNFIDSSIEVNTNTEYILGHIVNNEIIKISINSTSYETKSLVGTTTHNSNDFIIGARQQGDSRRFIGTISEVLVFNKEVELNEQIKIYNYLSNKWNLTSTVDSDGDGLMDADDSQPTLPN